ncbi:MAG TPA: hypothetical protein DHV28_12125 [Ignavibacteriales bacterium]|nr:hypothetical protein [Ignavibacteriales bacterium]
MKSLFKILLLIFILAFISYSQQTENTNFITTKDSLKSEFNKNPLIQLQIKFDEFELRREFKDMKMSIPLDGDPQTVWLRTSLAIANTENTNQSFSRHFLSPLEKQYLENSKFDPVKYALGMVQAGAVGYLAYKHIKKYGFLK